MKCVYACNKKFGAADNGHFFEGVVGSRKKVRIFTLNGKNLDVSFKERGLTAKG